MDRNPEPIPESGAWTYISCNLRSTNCFAGLYIGGSDRPTHFLFLFLVRQSRKRVAEPHPWFETYARAVMLSEPVSPYNLFIGAAST